MPLRTDEIAQCEFCEGYSRLRELIGVKQKLGKHGNEIVSRGKSKIIGKCPLCGEVVRVKNIG